MKFIIIIFKPYHSWSKVITSFEEGVRICNYCSGLCEQTDDIVVGLRVSYCRLVFHLIRLHQDSTVLLGQFVSYELCTILYLPSTQFKRYEVCQSTMLIVCSSNCPPPRSYFQQQDSFHLYKKRHCPYEISYVLVYQWFQTFNNHVRSTSLKYRFEIFSLWLVDNPVMPDLLSH